MKRSVPLIATLVAAGLLAAACGGTGHTAPTAIKAAAVQVSAPASAAASPSKTAPPVATGSFGAYKAAYTMVTLGTPSPVVNDGWDATKIPAYTAALSRALSLPKTSDAQLNHLWRAGIIALKAAVSNQDTTAFGRANAVFAKAQNRLYTADAGS